jgi:hypothetical protein
MLSGKYRNQRDFNVVRFYRELLRLSIRNLTSWQPLKNPKSGYTIAVACHHAFPEILEANLNLLVQQDLTHFDHLICAFDAVPNQKLALAEKRLRKQFPELQMEFCYQTPFQALILKTINWGWVHCWLSYCNCIARAKTRYMMLHDMDAMLLDNHFIEERYQAIQSRQHHFLGGRWYTYNGVEEEDKLLYIVELMFDLEFLRNHFSPIDVFNYVCLLNGRSCDLDILLFPQLKTEKKSVLPISETQWVHPSQVISQFTYLANRKNYIPPSINNLFFIPYFLFMAGNSTILKECTSALRNADAKTSIDFLGFKMNMSKMDEMHMRFVRKQIGQIEYAIAGHLREEVDTFLQAIEAHVMQSAVASV